MEYTVKKCPKCNGELHIPINLKTCICMFCGETFELQNEGSSEVPDSTLEVIKADYHKALEGISSLVENFEKLLPDFTKNKYSSSFEKYVQVGISVLLPIERYATLSAETIEKVVEETAEALIDIIVKDITLTKGGLISSAKSQKTDQYRFFLTVFTIPMICYLKYDISEPLADCVIEKWRNRFPAFTFSKGNFENLQDGFKRKGMCFITSAVCESMDKADNGYELTAFRKFRDTYMQQTKERQALIEEYYQIAPAIVASIDMRPESKKKYNDIWQVYLQPCLKDIEENRLAQCEKHYTMMVQNLKKEYYITSNI